MSNPHDLALTITCPLCDAEPGQPCIRTTLDTNAQPRHTARLANAHRHKLTEQARAQQA